MFRLQGVGFEKALHNFNSSHIHNGGELTRIRARFAGCAATADRVRAAGVGHATGSTSVRHRAAGRSAR
jgi:hypothetical protein